MESQFYEDAGTPSQLDNAMFEARIMCELTLPSAGTASQRGA